jgi:predicted transport protein
MNILSKDDFIEIIRLIESYVFRRAVCGIPTNSLNKTFAGFGKSIIKENYLESVKAHFNKMTSYRRFPNDEEFVTELKYRDLYNFRSRSYWLRRLENHERKERVNVSEYTIEHILPQNNNLNLDWRRALGPDWEKIQQKYVHTIGNLTLTGYNSEYSDKFFTDKRDMKGGFRESPLKLNRGLANLETWNEETIVQRAENLAKEALKVWQYPQLEQTILDQYRKKEETLTEYSIDSYEYLNEGKAKNLFEKLRKEVLSLDPEISGEYLKHYIAYKLETNIVDVVPQKDKLKLYINIKFNELNDPRKLCRDVSQIGHWGNGDVELILSSEEDIAYVINLVRQAIEKQYGNGESI